MTKDRNQLEDRLRRHYGSMATYKLPEPVNAAGWKGRAGVIAAVAGVVTVGAVGWQQAGQQDLATVTPASESESNGAVSMTIVDPSITSTTVVLTTVPSTLATSTTTSAAPSTTDVLTTNAPVTTTSELSDPSTTSTFARAPGLPIYGDDGEVPDWVTTEPVGVTIARLPDLTAGEEDKLIGGTVNEAVEWLKERGYRAVGVVVNGGQTDDAAVNRYWVFYDENRTVVRLERG